MMGHQVVWAACSVTNPKTGVDKVLVKGDMLPDWVSEFTKFVLSTSGAVQVVEDPDPGLVPEDELPPPVRLAEHPPPTVGPVNFRSSKEQLVAYGVAQGGNRNELDGKTVKELQALYLKGDGQPA
jgi:hypothetical protein